MRFFYGRVLLGVSTLSLSACISLLTTLPSGHGEVPDNNIYMGTRTHIDALQRNSGSPLAAIDFPLTLAMDTLLLPYTVPHTLSSLQERRREREQAAAQAAVAPSRP